MRVQTPQDLYCKVDNINTRFWSMGDQGTSVVLIHGLGGSIENWTLNINELAQHHRVYSMDLMGFGRSDKTLVTSLDDLVQFIKDFMKVQNIDKASLVGNSLGGGLALGFAIRFPENVEKLVLVASAGLGTELSSTLRFLAVPFIGEFFTRPSRKAAARVWEKIVHDRVLITDELIEQSYQLAVLPGARRCFLSTLRAGVNFRGQRANLTHSVIDKIAALTVPTMIIWGKQDRILPVAHAQIAAGRIPNAKLHLFDRCGHTPQLEHPKEFNSLVLGFLAG